MTDTDVFYYIRGFMDGIAWPVIAIFPSRDIDMKKIECLADCCGEHGCIVVFPHKDDVATLRRYWLERSNIIIAEDNEISLDQWSDDFNSAINVRFYGVFCDVPDIYMSIIASSPKTIKKCKFIFTPITTYSGGTRIRADIKQIAQGWGEYRRWAYENGNDRVLLYNEGV